VIYYEYGVMAAAAVVVYIWIMLTLADYCNITDRVLIFYIIVDITCILDNVIQNVII